MAMRLEAYGVGSCVFLAPPRLASANCARKGRGGEGLKEGEEAGISN